MGSWHDANEQTCQAVKRTEGEAPTNPTDQHSQGPGSEFPSHSPSMDIPTAVIHRLQSSLREAIFAPSVEDAPAPPFPSVSDAVAAFDSGAASVSAEFRCVGCGSAGGLLRGAHSALCAYCGCPRRGEEAEGGGSGGIAFRNSAAYRCLLGSLGLDGSVSFLPTLFNAKNLWI
jgi:hypothetical protein